MKVLVLNCGSSSLKYQLLDMEKETVLAKGLVERIGLEGSRLIIDLPGREKIKKEQPFANHEVAINAVLEELVREEYGILRNLEEITAIGHRIVHGGEKFSGSVIINEEILKAVEECVNLAPLHNPPNILGIRACQKLLPNTPQVGVFDTAFHQTMPRKAYLYGVPYYWYEKYGIRRYGFHGTSHKYVAYKASEILGKPLNELKIITCHLGNGSSVAAVKEGKSIDTSMGFTPLEGLMMGTRSGNIDPAIVTFIQEKEGLSAAQVNDILNKKSGVLGISGYSDFRDIEERASAGDDKAKLALEMFCYQVAKYIGAYAAAMNGVDAIVFTAGVGENSDVVRKEVCKYLEFLGATLDEEKNKIRGKEAIISKPDSKVKIMVIPTNEELMIAKETLELVANK
ncbi:acetate/propionate family kinase [Carboxydothermus ferrireducens]|uniref:Acetate kinase n=1 Tax=Carboxydothermus ferrireducens DSM 11255 TaxID=1119529 RepID=A0ABX2RBD6_9THEO|nr:acetate kinase [Carboxydothermus ferrireducens]NYE58224.1 acetate kinase [Carboxydothermus ferrireducens DSM 11255]